MFIQRWIVFALLISFNVFADDFTNYNQCFLNSLPQFASRTQARSLLIGMSACVENQNISLFEGSAFAKLNQKDPACKKWLELTDECRSFIDQCSLNSYECFKAVEAEFGCLPFLVQGFMAIQVAGIEDAKTWVDSLLKLKSIGLKCTSGKEYGEDQPPVWWEHTCDDFKRSPISFSSLNNEYYLAKTSFERTELLESYAQSDPAGVRWQVQVSNIMALDSLSSEDPFERAAAAKVLHQHGDYSAPVLYTLLNHVHDADANTRAQAVLALRTQGNRKALVVYSLLQSLYDENSEVRGNAALALKEQGVTDACDANAESRYFVGSSQQTPAICKSFNEGERPDPTSQDPNDSRFIGSLFDSKAKCGDIPPTSSNVFDSLTSPDSVKRFDISRNLCFLHVPYKQTNVMPILLPLLVGVMQTEKDVQAKAKMVLSLRTLGKGSSLALTLVRSLLNDENYRIRAAAVFALSGAAKEQPWVYSELKRLLTDPSPTVRKTVVAAVSELMPLEMKLDSKDSSFMMYQAGVTHHRAQATDCEASRKAGLGEAAQLTGDAFEFFLAGFNSSRDFYEDALCHRSTAPGNYPVLLYSSPEIGSNGYKDRKITLKFKGRIAAEMIQKKTELVYRSTTIPLKLISHSIDSVNKATQAVLEIGSPLQPDQYYLLVLKEGLETQDGEGWNTKRTILFKTFTEGLADAIAQLMSNDPQIEVQVAAAEAFVQTQQKEVLEFLFTKLEEKFPRSIEMSASFLMSPVIDYSPVRSLPKEKKYKFVLGIITTLMEQIQRFDRSLTGPQHSDDYLMIPALANLHHLLKHLLSIDLLKKDQIKALNDQLNLKDWILKRLKRDFPLREYSYYERLYYPSIREGLIELLDENWIDRKTEIDTFHLIYQSEMKSEDP